MSTPPLPAGYALDAPPPLPSGYKLDSETQQEAPPPSTYEKLTAPIDPGAHNPVTRFLSSVGGTAIGAVGSAAKAAAHPMEAISGAIDSTSDAIDSLKSYADPKTRPTWEQIKSVLPEALGTGVGGYAVGEAGGAALKGAGGAVAGVVKRVLPNAERAGAAFADVKNTVGNVPIKTASVGDTALELYTQAERGAQLPQSVRKLLNRVTKPDSSPLTYAEAKDFQSNISRLSADEMGKLNPNTKRLVGQLNANLKDSLIDAADHVGKGEKLADAFTEYRKAMKIKGFSEKAIEYGIKTALGLAGLGAAEKLRRMIP